ncbi:Ankyrin repeat and IBR domain-containing protein 1 [Ameca splendens]|uniref:RBR-type E3 ubiquitin transferase n=1 Tax=Ameca splendens TaxID=208324 RepID=A0ABV0ZUV2_9TELE
MANHHSSLFTSHFHPAQPQRDQVPEKPIMEKIAKWARVELAEVELMEKGIQEGEAHNIFCPAYDCYQLVPVEVIESVVSREMDKRYLQFDIKAFVENNPAIHWCPVAGCERAVRLNSQGPGSSTADPLSFPLLRAPAVDCGKGHLFCWECRGEAHEPCDCDTWKLWLQKVTEMKPEEMAGVSEAYEDAANCLWLLSNSKPCPSCKSPIQKNEGCNHMQCAKVR